MLTRDSEPQFRESLESFMRFFNKQCSDFDVGVWWSALKRFDLMQIRIAFADYAKNTTSHMTPKPAAIRALIAEPREQEIKQAPSIEPRPEILAIMQRDGLSIQAGESSAAFRNRMRSYIRNKIGGNFLPDHLMRDEDADELMEAL